MTETIIIENGEIKISQTQEPPAPVKVGLAIMLRGITRQMDQNEDSLNQGQAQLDRICSQLTDAQWDVLAVTQVKIIAVRNTHAQSYLTRSGK